jgi:hypothetical protein
MAVQAGVPEDLSLAVVSISSMFTAKMFVHKVAGDRLHLWVKFNGFQSHLSDDLQGIRILYRFSSIWSPNKETVASNKHRAHLCWIEMLESLDNNVGGFPFISKLDFFSGHGHFTVKVVCVGSAEAGNSSTGLSEGDRVARVSVNY